MYREYFEYNEKTYAIDDSNLVVVIKGNKAQELISLENEMEVITAQINSCDRAIDYHKNRIKKGLFMKQILGKIMVVSYLSLMLILPFIEMTSIWIIIGVVYALSFGVIIDLDKKMDKSAKDDCARKVLHFEHEIKRLNELKDYMKKEYEKINKECSLAGAISMKPSRLDELRRLKETYENSYLEKEKTKKKQK